MIDSYPIEAVARGGSNAIRVHEHPMLESGNISFPEGRYLLDFVPGEGRSSYIVTHRIEGAPLISDLLASSHAEYVCVVSSPVSWYRQPHVSKNARQEVRWNTEELGEAPLFTPMIVCCETQEIALSMERHGVHEIWDNQIVTLHKGSRLALGSVIQFESSILHLLSLHEDRQLGDGQFVVEIETEPFRFRVNVAAGLHQFLRYRIDDANRHNIMTHVVTACLARLQHDFSCDDGESGWKSHRNLRAFSDYLDHKGLEHWTDSNFRPESVATALHPHVLPKNVVDDENGESE